MHDLLTRLLPRSQRVGLVAYAIAFVLLCIHSSPTLGAAPSIGILYSNESPAQLAVVNKIKQVLLDAFSETPTILTATVDGGGNATLSSTSHDLVITVGVEAAVACRDLCGSDSLLRTLIPARTADAMLLSGHNNSIYSIYLDQPLSRLLNLSKIALPYDRDVGVLLGPSSTAHSKDLRRVAKRLKISLNIEQISNQSELITALERLLKQSEVLLALPDPLIYNRFTVQKILLTTYRLQRPVVSFSAALVRAGATMAVYSSPEQIGQHVGEAAIRIVNHTERRRTYSLPPRYYSVAVNHQVAHSLGITLPDEETLLHMLQDAER